MLVIGYDDDKGAFRFMNSWGTNWGDQGFAWVSYSQFSRMVREGFVAKDAQTGNGPSFRTVVPNTPNEVLPKPNQNVVTPNQRPQANVAIQLQSAIPGIHPTLGQGMNLQGIVSIPPGVGQQSQVIVKEFLNRQKSEGAFDMQDKMALMGK